MTITIESFVAGTASSNTTCNVTVAGCVAGDALVVLHVWDGAVTENAPTCPSETVATVGTQGTGISGWSSKFRWHLIENVQASGDKTVTATISGAPASVNCVVAWRLSGTNNSAGSPYDTSANANGTTADPSFNLTTSASGAAILAGCETNNGASTAGSGYTLRTFFGTTRGQDDNDVGAAGSKTVPFTHATTTDWGITAIAIKSADGAAGGGKPAFYYAQL